jgi:hypothetical protein
MVTWTSLGEPGELKKYITYKLYSYIETGVICKIICSTSISGVYFTVHVTIVLIFPCKTVQPYMTGLILMMGAVRFVQNKIGKG